jgi:group I intron endonuclease
MYIEQIYMIRHNITGRMYIGRSSHLKNRIYSHFNRLRAGKHWVEDMQKDFDEYGDDFTVSVLTDSTVEGYSHNTEKEMMDKFQSTLRGVGYNYNDPTVTAKIRNARKKRSTKTKLRILIETLDDEQVLYTYSFLSKIFGEIPDTAEQKKR